MRRKNRCQASIEVMVVLGIVMTIFILVGYMVYRNYAKTNDLKVYIYGQRLSNHVADQINALNAVGDGHSIFLTLPPTLYGSQNYSLNFYPDEATAYIEGSVFSTGNDLRYSSPISTSNVRCFMQECNNRCNKSAAAQCLLVNDTVELRMVKSGGRLFLTQKYNIMQDTAQTYVVPFDGTGIPDPGSPPGFVKDAGVPWNVIYLYHNIANDSITLAFSLNITNGENAIMWVNEVNGDVLNVRSQNPTPPEFTLVTQGGAPQGQWVGNLNGIVKGGTIEFRDGFRLCVRPDQNNMPSQNWTVLSADGQKTILSKTKTVCVAYP